jgi:hypothetical protein
MYREVYPRLFENLRITAQSQYGNELVAIFQTALQEPREESRFTNSGWCAAASVYPYPLFQLVSGSHEAPDDSQLALAPIRGNEWSIRRGGRSNPYFRPAKGLQKMASWGTVVMWDALFYARLTEVATSSSWLESYRDASVTQLMGAAWAHEVKGYTGPIIRDLEDVLSNAVPEDPRLRASVEHSWHAVLILNAVSYAIQIAISQRTPGLPRMGESLLTLPALSARAITEAVLDYLLSYRQACRPHIALKYTRLMKPSAAIAALAKAVNIDDSDALRLAKKILTSTQTLGPIAILREVVENIRSDHPIDREATPEIDIVVEFSQDAGELLMKLTQRQLQSVPWPTEMEVRGLTFANSLFGDNGAGIGMIIPRPIVNERLGKNRFRVTYQVDVAFRTQGG